MSRIHVQALYVMKTGRTYRSSHKVVDEGHGLFDFEQELKYQLALKDYPIEFVNDHGHRQFVQPSDVESIVAVTLGYEQAPVAQAQADPKVEPAPDWTPEEKEMIRKASGGQVVETESKEKFSTHLPMPEVPRQKVRVKSSDPNSEETQEIALPWAAIDAVRRATSSDQPHGPARTAALPTRAVKLGAGAAASAPTP